MKNDFESWVKGTLSLFFEDSYRTDFNLILVLDIFDVLVRHAINIVELHFADKLGHVRKDDKSKSKTILHLCAIIVPADFLFIFN